MKRPRKTRIPVVLALPSLLVIALTSALLARAPGEPTDAGIAAFVLSDFGGITRATLETNALPYKLVATALIMREERVRDVRLGFLWYPPIVVLSWALGWMVARAYSIPCDAALRRWWTARRAGAPDGAGPDIGRGHLHR